VTFDILASLLLVKGWLISVFPISTVRNSETYLSLWLEIVMFLSQDVDAT